MYERLSQTTYTVERMQPDDVEAMLALHREVWLDTFANEAFGLDPVSEAQRINDKNTPEEIDRIRAATQEPIETAERAWFIAKDNEGKVIGMTRPWRADEEGLQRVGAMYVDKKHQGQGVADALMDEVIKWADPTKPLYLWVAARNDRAQGFYGKRGFEIVEGAYKEVYGNVPHVKMVRKGGMI